MSDLINRQEAIDYFFRPYSNEESYSNVDIEKILKSLPSAQPKQRTGYWKNHIFDGIMGGRPRALVCSYCNRISLYKTEYCPYCGAHMNEDDL